MKNEDIQRIELLFVNAFLVKVKNGFILIDTGLSLHWEKLEHELVTAGCLPDKLKLVIITHGDSDHAGNCAKLQEKYKCKIAIHEADVPLVENGITHKRKTRTLRAKILFRIKRILRRKIVFNKFKPDILLKDGQDLMEFGLDAKIIHLPGHTKGSIGIISENILIAGDTYTNNWKPDIAILIDNENDLRKSLALVKNLNIKTIYPGHGKPFDQSLISYKL